jgi:hypothetical protein
LGKRQVAELVAPDRLDRVQSIRFLLGIPDSAARTGRDLGAKVLAVNLELQADNSRAIRSSEEGHVSADGLILKGRNYRHYRQQVVRRGNNRQADDEAGQETGNNPECASK